MFSFLRPTRAAECARRAGLAALLLVIVFAPAGCFLNSHNLTVAVESAMLQTTPDYVRSIEILLGAELALSLFSNATTGFLWSNPAELSDPSVLEQTDHKYRIRSNARDGEPGHEVFTFETLRRGACTIRLEYKRPFEAGVLYTCTVNVEVK